MLKPAGEIAAPVDGVTLTGIGYADGRLHVQAYYADILKTDNHGSISLVNRETGEQIDCDGSVAFFDEAGTGSYEDYVFTGIEADTLDTYALYGMFVDIRWACGGKLERDVPVRGTPRATEGPERTQTGFFFILLFHCPIAAKIRR